MLIARPPTMITPHCRWPVPVAIKLSLNFCWKVQQYRWTFWCCIGFVRSQPTKCIGCEQSIATANSKPSTTKSNVRGIGKGNLMNFSCPLDQKITNICCVVDLLIDLSPTLNFESIWGHKLEKFQNFIFFNIVFFQSNHGSGQYTTNNVAPQLPTSPSRVHSAPSSSSTTTTLSPSDVSQSTAIQDRPKVKPGVSILNIATRWWQCQHENDKFWWSSPWTRTAHRSIDRKPECKREQANINFSV
jgi:hypothetical protein